MNSHKSTLLRSIAVGTLGILLAGSLSLNCPVQFDPFSELEGEEEEEQERDSAGEDGTDVESSEDPGEIETPGEVEGEESPGAEQDGDDSPESDLADEGSEEPEEEIIPDNLVVTPEDLNLGCPIESENILISGQMGGAVHWTIESNDPRVETSRDSGITPQNVEVTATDLTESYTATLTIASTDNPVDTIDIFVSVEQNPGVIGVSTNELDFYVNRTAATVEITNDTPCASSAPLSWEAASDNNDVTVSPPFNVGPSAIEIEVLDVSSEYSATMGMSNTNDENDTEEILIQVHPIPAPGSGELTFIEALFDGENGVFGLTRPSSVAISPDGAHIYVTAIANSVAVFLRNSETGELTFAQFLQRGFEGVDGLDHPTSVTVSSDGLHVYVSAVTDQSVAIFSRNLLSGVLTYIDVVKNDGNANEGLVDPETVTTSPDGNHVYVAGGRGGHGVAVFAREAATGLLTHVQGLIDYGGFSLVIAPDGNNVYLVDPHSDSLTAFARNPSSGELTYIETFTDEMPGIPPIVDGLAGARAVVVSPDGLFVYVISSADAAFAIFSRNLETGELTFVETLFHHLIAAAQALTISSCGGHLYVGGGGIISFSRNASTGLLSYLGVPQDTIDSYESVTLSPDNRHLYVASEISNAVAVFSRSP